MKGAIPVQSNSQSATAGQGSTAVGMPVSRRRHIRTRRLYRFSAAHVAWSGLLRILQRVVHYKHGDRLEFKLNFSVRDLVAEKSKAVKAQFEALIQAVQKAGSYPAREEAARAVHAVMDALKDKLPPDVLSRVAESLQLKEAARRGRAVAHRLHGEDPGKGSENLSAAQSEPAGAEPVAEPQPADK
jgi:uncharacterized protein (DUF2267 family)